MSKRNKILKKFALSIILLIFLSMLVFCGFCLYVYVNAPAFNKENLYKEESSNIYDSENNLIATIGSEKRQIIKYEDIPEVFLDALIATEDSRFYEHNGFDAPRFLVASFSWLKGIDGGGASTLSMQISKNSFTSFKTEGFDGIVRKFTDIYISVFKLNKEYTKEQIIEYYVNAPYLGSGSYGIEQASLTYFGKSVSDLNLIESALIAGLFQAPSEYDPFINPDKANERKNTVIYLMLRHGYIDINTYRIAINTNIKNFIVNNNVSNPYQGFIDTIVEEVIDKTGNNPYEVSMDIYSTMIKSKQDIINEFYNTHNFKDDKVQVGIGVIDNDTGSIIAVGAGRNKISELSFNYATQIKRHPGSTAKPLFDYGPGIEYNNWSTATIFEDKPIKYTNGGTIKNIDGLYNGTLSLQECLVKSRNTCALQAFKRVNNSKINEFVTSLGITPEYLNSDSKYINEAHSIGAFSGVSPVSLAAAYAAFGNNGIYNEPHSVNRIVYKYEYGDVEYNMEYDSHRAMKETTAYLISYVLLNVTSYKTKVKDTEIATKTGTSSYDSKLLKSLGLSSKTIQDSWTVTYTSDYSIAIWYGYDELSKEYYITNNESFNERTNIQSFIVKNIIECGAKFTKPNGIISTSRSTIDSNGNTITFKGLVAKK